ncbi:MAG: hypothetical protein ACOYJ1_14470 [Peptococcales bacterium]
MRTFKYVLIYLLIIQFALYYFVPLDMVYGYRMDYEVLKDNIHNIDTILEQISKEIKQKELRDYLIILGDSVAFSGPGHSTESIGYYLEEMITENEGQKATRVFNLSMPAMQVGDIYTMLLKLDEYDISTQNLIFNITYAGFVKRNPDPPSVFWLQDDLKNMDEVSYYSVKANLEANNPSKDNKDFMKHFTAFLQNTIYPKLSLFQYKDFIKNSILNPNGDDALGDARVWSEKEGLRELLNQYEYQLGFSPDSFDMSSRNPQVYFLNKIIEHQRDKNTLIFLAGTNEVLMAPEVSTAGYQDNLKRVDEYFQNKGIKYLNLQGKLPDSLFTDHIHLTPAGYYKLAEILYNHFLGNSEIEQPINK